MTRICRSFSGSVVRNFSLRLLYWLVFMIILCVMFVGYFVGPTVLLGRLMDAVRNKNKISSRSFPLGLRTAQRYSFFRPMNECDTGGRISRRFSDDPTCCYLMAVVKNSQKKKKEADAPSANETPARPSF